MSDDDRNAHCDPMRDDEFAACSKAGLRKPIRNIDSVRAPRIHSHATHWVAVVFGWREMMNRTICGTLAANESRARLIERNGKDESATGFQHARDLTESTDIVFDVLENISARDEIEGFIRERKAFDVLTADAVKLAAGRDSVHELGSLVAESDCSGMHAQRPVHSPMRRHLPNATPSKAFKTSAISRLQHGPQPTMDGRATASEAARTGQRMWVGPYGKSRTGADWAFEQHWPMAQDGFEDVGPEGTAQADHDRMIPVRVVGGDTAAVVSGGKGRTE